MTSNQVRGLAADAATEEQTVAQYLQHNADFFERSRLVVQQRLSGVAKGTSGFGVDDDRWHA